MLHQFGQADVSGRIQRIELGPGAPLVYVDFAHTPQAIAAALKAVGSRRRIAVVDAVEIVDVFRKNAETEWGIGSAARGCGDCHR